MAAHLTHIALPVRDLPASSQFYQEFCALVVVHDRGLGVHQTQWLAPVGGCADTVILVLIAGGTLSPQAASDYRHLGFALPSRAAVDRCASKAQARGQLVWSPREEAWPLGYYCGVADPDGQVVEFSFGQPQWCELALLRDS